MESNETQADTTDWKQVASFWQLKYLELQQHTNQIITQLLGQNVAEYIAGQLIAQAGQAPVPTPPPVPPAESVLNGQQPAGG